MTEYVSGEGLLATLSPLFKVTFAEAKHFNTCQSIQIPLSLLIQVGASAGKPRATPWEAGCGNRKRTPKPVANEDSLLNKTSPFICQLWPTQQPAIIGRNFPKLSAQQQLFYLYTILGSVFFQPDYLTGNLTVPMAFCQPEQ